MLQPSTLQTQYVIGKDDLESIINDIVDTRMAHFFDNKKKEAEGEKLLTPKEVSELFDVNITTLWRWHKEGYLTRVYIGNKPRYKQSDIDRILMKGGQQ